MDGPYQHASRAHANVHEEFRQIPEIDATFVREFGQAWSNIETEIKRLQDTKAAMLKKVSCGYSRAQADALKLTMKLVAMGAQKRGEIAITDRLARSYVSILEGEINGTAGNA